MARTVLPPDLASMDQTLSAHAGFICQRKFYDDVHFPRGFSRCGDFTTKEAGILENYGWAHRDPGRERECSIFNLMC